MIVDDLFTGTPGTSLAAHSPNVGGAWAVLSGASGNAAISPSSGNLSETLNGSVYYNAAVSTSPSVPLITTIAYTGASSGSLATFTDNGTATGGSAYESQVTPTGALAARLGGAAPSNSISLQQTATGAHMLTQRRIVVSGTAIVTTFVDSNPVVKVVDAAPGTLTGRTAINFAQPYTLQRFTAQNSSVTGLQAIVCEGDSLTVGVHCSAGQYTTQGTCYPAVLQQSLPATAEVSNIGQSGALASAILSSRTTQLLTDPSMSNSIGVLLAGLNDVAQGASAATAFASIQSWHTAIVAAGFKTVACTIPHYGPASGLPTNYVAANAIIDSLNALIRGAYPTASTALADLAANANLLNYAATAYRYSDQLHYIDAGYALVAQIVATAVASI